jgi:hydrogenase maturation protease
MMRSQQETNKVLILGIGNVLMGDEGVGVRVVDELRRAPLPDGVDILDGGVGSFLLLEPMRGAETVILSVACSDGAEAGEVRRLRPRYSTDYPKTLTAHDIGLKDLLDAFYLLGQAPPDVTLFAVSIPPLQDMTVELSPSVEEVVPRIAELVREEVSLAFA